MIEMLAQGTAEGIGIGAGGTAALAVLCLFIKRGFSVRVGDGNGTKDAVDGGSPNGICSHHDGLIKQIESMKATTDTINGNVTKIMFHLMGNKGD